MPRLCLILAWSLLASQFAQAAEPVTLESAVDPGANAPDEPLAAAFSEDSAVQFLDSAALNWQKQRECFTCHTNYAYLCDSSLRETYRGAVSRSFTLAHDVDEAKSSAKLEDGVLKLTLPKREGERHRLVAIQ